ncbi:MAG: hypothetical protein SO436_06455, partial [Oscillospiraceae bacterium]|nr:hypothetical protein [Oscillospiraceae bacterium]
MKKILSIYDSIKLPKKQSKEQKILKGSVTSELPQVVQTVQKQTSNGRKLKFKQQTDFVFQAESVLFLFEYDICCKS